MPQCKWEWGSMQTGSARNLNSTRAAPVDELLPPLLVPLAAWTITGQLGHHAKADLARVRSSRIPVAGRMPLWQRSQLARAAVTAARPGMQHRQALSGTLPPLWRLPAAQHVLAKGVVTGQHKPAVRRGKLESQAGRAACGRNMTQHRRLVALAAAAAALSRTAAALAFCSHVTPSRNHAPMQPACSQPGRAGRPASLSAACLGFSPAPNPCGSHVRRIAHIAAAEPGDPARLAAPDETARLLSAPSTIRT